MEIKQKEADTVMQTKRRASFAAAVAGTLALLVASPEHIYINGAPIPSAFTI